LSAPFDDAQGNRPMRLFQQPSWRGFALTLSSAKPWLKWLDLLDSTNTLRLAWLILTMLV